MTIEALLPWALGIITTGVCASVGLLVRLNTKVAYQNGSVARVVKEFEEHKKNDRDDFRRIFDKLDELRGPLQ